MVLDLCCGVSDGLMLVQDMVSDHYGGYCDNPSLILPSPTRRRLAGEARAL